jgi:hypothetical protein
MGEVIEKRGLLSWIHFEKPWPKEIRCEWCFTRPEVYQKHRACLRVQLSDNPDGQKYVKLCLCCWLTLAFQR